MSTPRVVKCKKTVDVEKGVIAFAFTNGKTFEVRLSDFNADLIARAALHGLSQKLGDEYADAETAEDAALAFDGLLTRLIEKGVEGWRAEREGGGSSQPQYGLLVQAVARAYNKSVEEIAPLLAKASEDQLKSYRALAKVKAAQTAIQAERAAAKAAKAADKSGEIENELTALLSVQA